MQPLGLMSAVVAAELGGEQSWPPRVATAVMPACRAQWAVPVWRPPEPSPGWHGMHTRGQCKLTSHHGLLRKVHQKTPTSPKACISPCPTTATGASARLCRGCQPTKTSRLDLASNTAAMVSCTLGGECVFMLGHDQQVARLTSVAQSLTASCAGPVRASAQLPLSRSWMQALVTSSSLDAAICTNSLSAATRAVAMTS
jgi:hypothetical protein